MAWPPATLPVNFGNATVSLNTHPQAHNNVNDTINSDIVPEINALRALIEQINPPGAIIGIADINAVPAGWVQCSGQLITTTSAPKLFDLWGYTYGGLAGNFGLPNMSSRTLHGGAPGTYSGTNDIDPISHSHTVNANTDTTGQHGHNIGDGAKWNFFQDGSALGVNYVAPGGPTYQGLGNAGPWEAEGASAGSHAHSVSATTSTTGSSGSNANIPANLGVRWCVYLQ